MQVIYIVESCGSTLESTPVKSVAYSVYDKALGPDVRILERNSIGQLRTVQRKVRGLRGTK